MCVCMHAPSISGCIKHEKLAATIVEILSRAKNYFMVEGQTSINFQGQASPKLDVRKECMCNNLTPQQLFLLYIWHWLPYHKSDDGNSDIDCGRYVKIQP